MPDHYAPIESRPWNAVKTLQAEKIQPQLEYLRTSSAYYRERFEEWDLNVDEVETIEDLAAIPFTTKDDERTGQDGSESSPPLGTFQAAGWDDVNRVVSSSGTTGTPTYFGLTSDDLEEWHEMGRRAVYAAGVRPGDTVLHAVGKTIVPGGLPYVQAMTDIGATVIPAGSESTERILQIIQKLEVEVLFTTASHLQYLADRAPAMIGNEVSDLSVEKLIGGGEPGTSDPEIRARLYEEWDASSVREVMGIGDVAAALSGECRAEDGMHFVGHEYVLMELIDPDTGDQLAIEDGAEGELVYTSLEREASPVLRFRSGDYARIVATDCECGRTSPRLQIVGRSDDMVIYKAQNVYPTAIREVVGDVPGASVRMKVVLPHEGKVQFDEPIPIDIVRDAESDRDVDEIRVDVASTVRDQLSIRVEPRIVDADDVELDTYKTDLLEVAEDAR